MEVAGLIDEPVWAIHEVVRRAIVACSVDEPEWDPVLFCEDKAVLLALNTMSANIWGQIAGIGGTPSVLVLAATTSCFDTKESLRLCCHLSS